MKSAIVILDVCSLVIYELRLLINNTLNEKVAYFMSSLIIT
jgi:hypothetical protein